MGQSTFMTGCFQMLVTGTNGVPGVCRQWAQIRATVAVEDPAGDSVKDQSFNNQLEKLTLEDDHARSVVEQLKKSTINSLSGLSSQPYSLARGRLYYEGRIYILEALRDVVMERYYDSPLAGHFGAEKTQALI